MLLLPKDNKEEKRLTHPVSNSTRKYEYNLVL